MGNRIVRVLANKKHKTKLEIPEVQEFAVGETKVRLKRSVRSSNIFLIQSPIDKYNQRSIQDNIQETLMTVNALKGCGASSVMLVIPCLPYTRQDKRFGREPCTAALLAQQFVSAGINHLITVDIHASQIKEYYNILGVQADALYASPILLKYIAKQFDKKNLWILSPDAGGLKRAVFYSSKLGVKVAVAGKSRPAAEINVVDEIYILGNLQGKDVIIVDDLVDTGGTIRLVIEKLHKQGAKSVSVCCAHPILSHPGVARLDKLYAEGKLKRLITTDSIYYPSDFSKIHPWFIQLPLAGLLGEVMLAIHQRKSISHFYL